MRDIPITTYKITLALQEFIRVNSLYTNGFISPQEDSLLVKVTISK